MKDLNEIQKILEEPKGWLKISPADIMHLNDSCKRLKNENRQLILSSVSSRRELLHKLLQHIRDEDEFIKLASKHLFVLESERAVNKEMTIYGLEKLYEAITVTQCCETLNENSPNSEHLKNFIGRHEEITKWYADKIGKTPDEFDEFDKHIETVIQTWEKERAKALTIPSLSKQRELLLDFSKYINDTTDMWRIPIDEHEIEEFLKTNL